jgi:hypothetical protein
MCGKREKHTGVIDHKRILAGLYQWAQQARPQRWQVAWKEAPAQQRKRQKMQQPQKKSRSPLSIG